MSLTKKEIEKAQETIQFLSSITPPDAAQTGVLLARPSARLLTVGHPNVSRRADSLAIARLVVQLVAVIQIAVSITVKFVIFGGTCVIMLIDNFATPHYSFINHYTTP